MFNFKFGRILALGAALSTLLPLAATAQPKPEGFLCCNLRTDGKWISDINYLEAGKRLVPMGTPAKVTGYGRYRVLVDLGDNTRQAIGNDYSRDIELGAFAQRYVVTEDPRQKLGAMPARQQEAINKAMLMPGMTRAQVLMSVGYPVSSENPSLDVRVWRFWLESFAEFQVMFDDAGLVKEISTDPRTLSLVVME